MKGEHQLQNVSVAIQVIELLVAQRLVQVDEHQLRSGLVQTSWVGRFEILSKEPLIVIDGAHNRILTPLFPKEVQPQTAHLLY